MLRALVHCADWAAAAIACLLVTTLLCCVALGVVTRGLGDPVSWTDELSRFLMVWLAVFGWILASRTRVHVRIRYFQDHLPPGAHRAVEIVIQLALTLFGILLAWYSIGLVGRNHDLEATSLPISMAWMYVPMVLAGIVTALQGAVQAVAAVHRPRAIATPPVGGDAE